MITLRTRAAGLLAAAGLVLAGCASTVGGAGSFEGAGPTSSGPTSSGPTATDEPTGTGEPTGTPTGSGPTIALPTGTGGPPNPDIPDSPCDVLDSAAVKQAFGEDVGVERDLDSCKISSKKDGSFLDINNYNNLALNQQKGSYPGGKDVTIADRPGYLAQEDHYLVVARPANPAGRGILTCYIGFTSRGQSSGVLIATKVMEQVIPHYSY